MKRFVIGTNRTTAEQDAAFYKILQSRWPHFGWWHQLGETWLLVDMSGTVTVEELRDAATRAFPGIYLIVVEAKGPHLWAGWGQQTDFGWLTETWDRKE